MSICHSGESVLRISNNMSSGRASNLYTFSMVSKSLTVKHNPNPTIYGIMISYYYQSYYCITEILLNPTLN